MTPGVVGTVNDGGAETPLTQLDWVTVGATALTCVGGAAVGVGVGIGIGMMTAALRTVALAFGVTLTAPALESVAVNVSTVESPAPGDEAGTLKLHVNE